MRSTVAPLTGAGKPKSLDPVREVIRCAATRSSNSVVILSRERRRIPLTQVTAFPWTQLKRILYGLYSPQIRIVP